MVRNCSHHISQPADGAFLAGHCPFCLLAIALESEPDDNGEKGDWSESSGSTAGAFSFTPGTILGDRFRLISMIGRGGMGEVYRADDLKLNQAVALKFLPGAVSRNAEALGRLAGEVRLGRQVAHPNVCRLYDLAEAPGQHFIVMELVDGEDLGSLLGRINRLPQRKAMEVARDLCAGLTACHEREVIHGDLKPGNVMIDGKGRARIMDFGLSTIVGTRPEDRVVAGTLAYMAPEQLHGSGVSGQADIYALGLILYEMFTGRRVHNVRTIDELKRAIDSQPAPPSTITRVPDEVEDMILRCLERKPARRPRSAAEVAGVFPTRDPIDAALSAGETPSPAMVAASEKVGDLSLRLGWSLLSVGVIGLLLAIAGAERFTSVGRSSLGKNPELLAEQAREIARTVAYPVRSTDEGYGFSTRSRLRSRNEPPSSSLAFFYRQSSGRLMPVLSLRRISPTDPPSDVPGIATIGLDPTGQLRFLRVVPSESDADSTSEPVSWEKLFEFASLDLRQFATVDSEWIPPVPYQQKQEWTAKASQGSVRAALFGGRAVYFDVADDAMGRLSRVVAEEDQWTRYAQRLYVSLLVLSFIAGGLLAHRNIRKGRSDLRGARRVAGWVLGCRLLFWIFSADIGSADINAQVMVRGIGQALFESAQVWLAYVALEPFVRRRWPRLIIGWNRLIEGRFADPLVGRDFLVGGLFGILLVLVEQLRSWSALRLGLPASQPLPLTVEMLSGTGEVIAAVFYCVARSLVFASLGLFLFLLMRAVVNRPVLAGALWIVAAALTWSRGEQLGTVLPVALTVAIVQAVFSLLVMVRFGLLATVTMFFVYLLLSVAPLTFDLRSWYAIASLVPVLIVGGLLAFGFHRALGRKPLFGRRILEA